MTTEKGLTTARPSLRLRDSPKDGTTLKFLKPGSELDVIGRETWLQVRTEDGRIGFVLADYVEPLESPIVSNNRFSFEEQIIEYPQSDRLLGEKARIHADFKEAMDKILQIAGAAGVQLWVTSSLREPYHRISGTVVPPAQRSNHHVGHAIDMNLIAGGEFFNSKKLGDPAVYESDSPVGRFIAGIRSTEGLQWGGDFDTRDPVHIDDRLNKNKPKIYQRKLESLWGQRYKE